MIRKIHLDFHTDPATRDIARDFDAAAFADTLAGAHVNALATPGKCHFGNIYYASRVGHTHPHLRDAEMFPRTVAACSARGIRVQAYWTLGLDAHIAQQHPEWRQRYADGTYGSWGYYLHMCFASPYIDRIVIPEVLECIERCPGLAGFWFDISLYIDAAFYSEGFEAAARARLGERASDVNARWQLAREIIRERCMQLDAVIKTKLPDAENYFNSLVVPGEPANIALQDFQEVENPILFGGPEKMTSNVRWLRGHQAPTIGLVSRFQGPWSDPGTLRTSDQMRFDVARTVALGCHVSMGDHRYPDGSLEPEVYRRLAPVYAEVKQLERWTDGAQPCLEATLLAPVLRGSGKGLLFPDIPPATSQTARLLEELGLQFDIATTEDDIPDAGLVIWPGEEPGSPELMQRLQRHVARGGALLAMGAALESPGAEALFGARKLEWTPPASSAVAVTSASVASIGHVGVTGDDARACGPAEQFVRLRAALGGEAFSQILTRPTRLIEALTGSEVLGDRHAPVSARPPFPAREPAGPMIVRKGRVIYCAADLFAEAAETGSPSPARIVEALCNLLLAAPMVRHSAGDTVVAHLHRTASGGRVLHFVQWALDRWNKQVNPARAFPVLGPIEVTLHAPEGVGDIRLQPQDTPLPFALRNGLCTFTLPRLHVWQVVSVD